MQKGNVFILLMLAGTGSALAATAPGLHAPVTEVVMRCTAPVEFSDRYKYVGLEVTLAPAVAAGPQISLLKKTDNRYDVLLGKDSLAAMGRLSSMQGGENPVHLVLDTVTSGVEHFLFVQNPDGSGELLWSSATASALTTCVVK